MTSLPIPVFTHLSLVQFYFVLFVEMFFQPHSSNFSLSMKQPWKYFVVLSPHLTTAEIILVIQQKLISDCFHN